MGGECDQGLAEDETSRRTGSGPRVCPRVGDDAAVIGLFLLPVPVPSWPQGGRPQPARIQWRVCCSLSRCRKGESSGCVHPRPAGGQGRRQLSAGPGPVEGGVPRGASGRRADSRLPFKFIGEKVSPQFNLRMDKPMRTKTAKCDPSLSHGKAAQTRGQAHGEARPLLSFFFFVGHKSQDVFGEQLDSAVSGA